MLPALGLYGHIRNNNLKSALLLAGFLGLSAAFWYSLCLLWTAVTWSLAQHWLHELADTATFEQRLQAVAVHAFNIARATWYVPAIVSFSWLGLAYTFHARLIQWATGTRELTRREHPKLYNMVERLAIEAGLPMPRIAVMNSGGLNAYAAGLSPDHATIAVTRGLLQSLLPAELEAVLAHEMTHIKNRDVRLMVVATIFAGGLTFLGEMTGRLFRSAPDAGWHAGDLVVAGSRLPQLDEIEIEGPGSALALLTTVASIVLGIVLLATVHLFALLTKFAISRSREYLADAGAIELTRNPDALIGALLKISGRDQVNHVPASLQAMMISNPFEGLFSTHPSIEDRVKRLQQFAGGRLPDPAQSRVLDPMTAPQGARGWGREPEPQPATAGFLPNQGGGFGRRRRPPVTARPAPPLPPDRYAG